LNWFAAFFVLFAIFVGTLLVLIFMALRVVIERIYMMQAYSKDAVTIIATGLAEIKKGIERVKQT
jgi:hypothetical protein